MFEENVLRDVVIGLIETGAAGLAVWWFLGTPAGEKLAEWLAIAGVWIDVGLGEAKRILAVFLSVVLTMALYAVSCAFGWYAWPVGPEGWGNVIVTVLLGFLTFTFSQMAHARTDERMRHVPETLLRRRDPYR